MVKATKSTKKATKKIAEELKAADCDYCRGRRWYLIDNVKQPCICSESQYESYDEVIRKAVTRLENKVEKLENLLLKQIEEIRKLKL